VIALIRERAEKINDIETMALCDEATGYAQRMSAKLEEIRKKEA
jgi:hypothetical protein